MEEAVKLGDGVSDGLKSEVNKEALRIGKTFIDAVSKYLIDKVQTIDFEELSHKLGEQLNRLSKEDEDAIVALWYSRLAEEGLLPKGYGGLSDSLLIDNLHQDGYLDGLYVGYALAMMSLVDNHASKELVIAVRDDVRPNLIRQHYNDSGNTFARYRDDKYSWVESLTVEGCR